MDVSLLTSPQAKHQRMYRGTSIYSEASQVDLERSTHKASAIVVSPDDSSDYDSSFVKGLLEKERRQMLDEQRSSFKGVKVRYPGRLAAGRLAAGRLRRTYLLKSKIFRGCTMMNSI